MSKEDNSMAAKCTLFCTAMNQRVDLNLIEHFVDMSSVDFTKCTAVFEDGSYNIHFSCEEYSAKDVETVDVCVNGGTIGSIVLENNSTIVKGYIRYRDNIPAQQPFLLHYDLVTLSFIIKLIDGTTQELFSDFLLCVSKHQEDSENIKNILHELVAFDDSQVGEWIFSKQDHGGGTGLYEGKWNKHSYKSLSSYIQLLEQVTLCYKDNYPYFKTQGKHTIKQSNVLVSYESVKNISIESFYWIMQNSEQLTPVPSQTGIQHHGKNYLPYQIRTTTNKKSWDTYENRIVVNFLYTVLLNAEQIHKEFDQDILNEERIISKIHGNFPREYRAPIITIKTLQISFSRVLLEKLRHSIEVLKVVYKQYAVLFDVPTFVFTSFPRKTRTFCEIKPYVQVFELIINWFQYGEYSLEKERLVLQVKTLDKLFEYYCLLKLLKLLVDNGYQKADIPVPVYKFIYKLTDDKYENERDVANTYKLSADNKKITLYYQPVISATGRFENDLQLYRTTSRNGYYNPDFVLKFSAENKEDEYLIFDAKFSSRDNIINHHLPEVMRKYSFECAVANSTQTAKMVWILQGRVITNEKAIWQYHNSPASSLYSPITSYGIVSINTTTEVGAKLWDQIKKQVTFL